MPFGAAGPDDGIGLGQLTAWMRLISSACLPPYFSHSGLTAS